MAEPAGELKQEASQKPIWPVVIGTVSMVIGAGMLLQFVVIFSGWCVLWAGSEIDIDTVERAFTCTEGILAALLIGAGDRHVAGSITCMRPGPGSGSALPCSAAAAATCGS